jgi:LuxR family quorum-sensing transcriptional regulator LasR
MAINQHCGEQMKTVILDELQNLDNAARWGEALFAIGHSYGFDKVMFALAPGRHSRLEQAFTRSNYPTRWRERYDAERFAYIDPVVSHCLHSVLPLIWQPELFRSAAQRAFYEEASSFGLRAGVSLPIHGPNGEFGVLTFASAIAPDEKFVREVSGMLPDLALLRDYAFASGMRFCPSAPNEAVPRLTPRELEVLNWVMVGKSSWEISKITGCSEATVNFHMGNIRQKFNVNTRQQAVVRAISLGLITPEDHHR